MRKENRSSGCFQGGDFDLGDNTGNDRYNGHGYSGIDRYSGTKTPDNAILFTVSGITVIVEQKFRKFQLKVIKDLSYFQKIR